VKVLAQNQHRTGVGRAWTIGCPVVSGPLKRPDVRGLARSGKAGILVARRTCDNVVSRAGLEPDGPQDKAQLIDSNNRQKRSNRYFRRFEVHGGYTGYEFVSSKRGRK
jgi:hypothetical protein